ncbi:hypothetical protein C5167_002895 [Papaver somniferum]|uniref:Tify domain-containing protein n=1 Tax=Papaver somniferum TaxID=3469 RepID=A0A4Y7L2N1_PAPSO|nr:uncharacterized protein LOC113310481 isoform X1 [Papaver somniferum]XP_026414956.1 uncharacterized protein LOC113310481 isoform X1 [Papaver somniferum]RZC78688.1 hypothetical protein C5167_002895 [Papaver somniferum]
MSKRTGCLTDGEMAYDNSSRNESKRAHPWFLDDTEQELLPSKKQAVGSSNSQSFPGFVNPVRWDNSSCFHSVPSRGVPSQFGDTLFGVEPARSIDLGARSTPSNGFENLDVGRRGIQDQFGNEGAIPLSTTHTMEDPGSCFSYGGIRKVKINEVKETDHGMSFPIGDAFNKGEISTISFGGFHDDSEMNPSARIISSYDMLMSQSSVHQPEVMKEKESMDTQRDIAGGTSQVVCTSKTKAEPKSAKKAPPANNFPSNARSLLATGMLDGVPVKYVSWPHEELHGTIKGPGYLCSCEKCNFSKTLNAYEFERHAGNKTKHPNSHIFFENGKTVYAVVQELRHTPQKMLFEVIQTVTGSPINQKNFNNWKESYEAATRELQRIYGTEDLSQIFQIKGS